MINTSIMFRQINKKYKDIEDQYSRTYDSHKKQYYIGYMNALAFCRVVIEEAEETERGKLK